MQIRKTLRFTVNLRRIFIAAADWCRKIFGERSSTLIMALIIGITAAFGVALMHFFVVTLTSLNGKLEHYSGPQVLKWGALLLFFFMPLIGLFLSHCVQHKWGGRNYAKSLSPLILALHRKRPTIPLTETFSHLLSSALAVGCGGSAGLEAPSVLTGAAIGANTGSFFFVAKKRRALLLGCGTSAAIAAIFDSPIAGVLFAAVKVVCNLLMDRINA